jgi:hypothetical protein
MDEVHLSVLRALAVDETPAEREEHALDLALLDAMTWPCYVWEWLRLTGAPQLGHGLVLSRGASQRLGRGGDRS